MIDPSAFVAPGAVLAGDVSIGGQSSVWYNSVVRGDMAPVHIGAATNIQDLSMLHVDAGMPCFVGDRVSVGHRVILHGCTVEDECLVGMGAILLNGVHLGSGSVVAAGALITEGTRIPAGSLVMGMPARVVRAVDASLRADIDFAWQHYVEQARDHATGKTALLTPPGRPP